MTFATADEVETIRGIWGTVLARDHEAARGWAIKRLREDLMKPDAGESPDAYLYRANAVPLGLMDARQFAIAENIYESLIAEVDAFISSRKVRKHRGALLANQAVCRILLGQFDRGVPQLVFTIEDEDPKTFGELNTTSPAMKHLEDLFSGRAKRILGLWCESQWFESTGDRPRTEAIEEVTDFLETAKWSLFASVIRTQELWESHLKFPSSYESTRLLDGLRGLCGSFEYLVKAIGKRSKDQKTSTYFTKSERLLLPRSLKKLFGRGSPHWWSKIEFAIRQKLTSFDAAAGPEDFRIKLTKISEWPARRPEELASRSFVTTILCRNYSAHELEPPNRFLDDDLYPPLFIRAMTDCAAAILLLPEMARLCGHIEGHSHDR